MSLKMWRRVRACGCCNLYQLQGGCNRDGSFAKGPRQAASKSSAGLPGGALPHQRRRQQRLDQSSQLLQVLRIVQQIAQCCPPEGLQTEGKLLLYGHNPSSYLNQTNTAQSNADTQPEVVLEIRIWLTPSTA